MNLRNNMHISNIYFLLFLVGQITFLWFLNKQGVYQNSIAYYYK